MALEALKNLDDVKKVWDRMEAKDWTSYFLAINEVRVEEGDSEALDKIQALGRQAQDEGKEFPQNLGDLTTLLKDTLSNESS